MPDKRLHRGPHPEDAGLFVPEARPRLRSATSDLSWLLSHGYSMVSALKLVGDRYQLEERQRLAVMRSACSDSARQRRLSHQVHPVKLAGQLLLIDGYNLLTSVEAALGGGVLLLARDGCFRDLASMHGTYRKVAETIPALKLIGHYLQGIHVRGCLWYLDSPVSNSGRLKTIIVEVATQAGWDWQVELVQNPDPILAAADDFIATADSVILDQSRRWMNLAREVISTNIPDANVVDLSGPS